MEKECSLGSRRSGQCHEQKEICLSLGLSVDSETIESALDWAKLVYGSMQIS